MSRSYLTRALAFGKVLTWRARAFGKVLTWRDLVAIPENQYRRGCESVFFPKGGENGMGLKFYPNETERNRVYELQRKLSEHGLTPKVGRKVDADFTEFPDVPRFWESTTMAPAGGTWCQKLAFGYETEVAEVGCSREQLNELRDKFYDFTGYSLGDYRTDNSGIIEGRPVILDLGNASTGLGEEER